MNKLSKLLTLFSSLSKQLTLISLVFLIACGKKENEINAIPQKINSERQDIITDPLKDHEFKCLENNCSNGIVKIFNFNNSLSYKSCVGAVIDNNKILTTASCLGRVVRAQDTCENIYIKLANQKKAFSCKKITSLGLPFSSYTYLRKLDYAIIETENLPKETKKIELSSSILKDETYETWTFLAFSQKDEMLKKTNCSIKSPDIQNEDFSNQRYKIECNEKYKLTEASMLMNKNGKLIAMYSRGKRYSMPNLITLGCLKISEVNELNGENCPDFENNQTHDEFNQQNEDFKSLKQSIETQSYIANLFKWDITYYNGVQIYEPVCYKSFEKMKKHLLKLFSKDDNIISNFITQRLIVVDSISGKNLKIENVKLEAIIDAKNLRNRQTIKLKLTELLKREQLLDYINGKHLHRSDKSLILCK